MKAKLNLTGEILDVRKHGDYYIDNDGCVMLPEDLTFIPEPDWQQVRIQAAIKLTCRLDYYLRAGYSEQQIAEQAVKLADALVAELKRSDDVYAECRRMDAINTASVCENMTNIQKELQKKDDNANV